MRGRGVPQSCTDSQDDSPHKKAANGIHPVVAVLLHVVLPTLPAGTGGLRWAGQTPGSGGSSQANLYYPAGLTLYPLVPPPEEDVPRRRVMRHAPQSGCPISPPRRTPAPALCDDQTASPDTPIGSHCLSSSSCSWRQRRLAVAGVIVVASKVRR